MNTLTTAISCGATAFLCSGCMVDELLVNRDDFLGIEDLLLVPQERTS